MTAQTAAEKLAAKAERLRQQQQAKQAGRADPEASDTTEQRLPAAANVRSKPIRSTIDLLPARHHEFKDWCSETAVQLGVSRVTTQDVVKTLVGRLLTDETLARKIRADLRTNLT